MDFSGSDYRDQILNYFERKDQTIYRVMQKNKDDWGFPFKTLYRMHYGSLTPFDLVGYMIACMSLNRYKPEIKEKSYLNLPNRGNRFLNKMISDQTIEQHTSAMSLTTYVTGQMMDRVEKNSNFKWFLDQKTSNRNNAEFIIIDTYNFFLGIKAYTGDNTVINVLKNSIIGENSLKKCIKNIAGYIAEKMNGNDYKYIFVANLKMEEFEDDYYILSSDCNEYIGTDCRKENLSGEVDDCMALMLYDYINDYLGKTASILSEDNYDFSVITQDFSYQIDRAFIDTDGNIINAQDAELKYPDFKFSREGGLSFFGEKLDLEIEE